MKYRLLLDFSISNLFVFSILSYVPARVDILVVVVFFFFNAFFNKRCMAAPNKCVKLIIFVRYPADDVKGQHLSNR